MTSPEQSPRPRLRRSRWKRAILYPPTIVVLILIAMALLFGRWLRNVAVPWFHQETPKTEDVEKDEEKPGPKGAFDSDSAAVREKIRTVLAGMKRSDVAVYGRVRHISGSSREPTVEATVSLARTGDYKREEISGFVVPSDGPISLTSKTDGNGLYFFRDNLVPGEYQLIVHPPRNRNLVSTTQPIVIKPADRLRKDILLPGGWVLTGRVVRADMKTPVAGAIITVHSLRPKVQGVRQCKSNENGRYKLGVEGELPCKVIATGPLGGHAFLRRVEKGTAKDKRVLQVDIVIPDPRTKRYVLLLVFTADKKFPKVPYEVRQGSESGKIVTEGSISPNKVFAIKGLDPGVYYVRIKDVGQWQTTSGKSAKLDLPASSTGRVKNLAVAITPK